MTYTADATRLARAMAALTAHPGDGERWPALSESERPAALAARDAVVSELRDLTRLVLRRPAPARVDLSLITANPAQALRVALDALPMATGSDTALTDTLTVAGGPLTSAWQTAARAAAALERHHDQIVAGLPNDDAWTLTRDLAGLALALPYLDADLAAALPPGDEQTRRLLLDPAGHGLIRLAATELQAQTVDLAPAAAHLAAPSPARPGMVRDVGELPPATRHLTALLTARGPALTAVEARAVARTLAAGADLTARILERAHPQQPDGSAAADHLHAAAKHLQKVANAKVATLRPPAPAVLFLTQQIGLRLTAARDLTDQLPRTQGSPAALDRIAPPLLAWAGEAAATTASLAGCLQAAADTGQLLAPRQDTGRGRTQHYLWLPTSRNTTAPDPVVSHARAAVDALAAAEQRIATATGEPTAADRRRAATRNAVAAAGTAFTELRTALTARTPTAVPRLPHPALPSTRQPTVRNRP